MKIYKRLLIISILPIAFIGCATNQPQTLEKKHTQSLQEKKIVAFTKASKSEQSLIIPVPAPNNIISRKIMLASIKAGITSNAIDSLVELLKLNAETPIAVISDENGSDDITAASIESALQKIRGIKTKATLYFIGEKAYGVSLQAKAQAAGVDYKFIAYPEE